MRQIDEERFGPVLADEVHGLVSEQLTEVGLRAHVADFADDLGVPYQRQRREIVDPSLLGAWVEGQMSFEYGIPKYVSNPCCVEEFGLAPSSHLPKQPVAYPS